MQLFQEDLTFHTILTENTDMCLTPVSDGLHVTTPDEPPLCNFH